jgi:hypothetical protein
MRHISERWERQDWKKRPKAKSGNNMSKIKLRNHTILVTAVLLIVVFAAGLILGRSQSNVKIDDINKYILDNELNTESFLIEQEIMGSFGVSCDISEKRLNDLFAEQVTIGRLLSDDNAEKTLGTDNYKTLKRKYHLMQIRTYIMYKNLIDNCNQSKHVVLYYYGRNDNNSLVQGHILDRVVKDRNISVFAIEFNFSKELLFLESSYGITSTPAIVIDYKDMRQGLVPYEAIIGAIDKQKD